MAGQSILTYAVGLADNVMVGSIGDLALSGVYMANQWTTLLQHFMTGLTNAALVLSAQYWGKKDTGSIKTITAFTFRLCLVFSLVFFVMGCFFPRPLLSLYTNEADVAEMAVRYLRIVAFSYLFFALTQTLIVSMKCVETVKPALYTSMSTLVVNVLLNYLLIFGKLGFPAMGVEGAAVATLVSRILETVIMVWYVRFKDRKLSLRLPDFRRRSKVLTKDYIHYGIPIFLGSVVWGINNTAQSAIIGRLGQNAISAVSISNNLFNIVSVGLYGVAGATAIIIGKTVGASKYDLVKKYTKTLQLVFVGIGVVTCVIMYSVQYLVPLLYTGIEEETLAISRQLIDVLAVMSLGTAYQVSCLTGIVRAGGKTNFVFINDSIFVFCVVLPLGYLSAFVWNAPAWVVFACLKCDQLLKCIVAAVETNSFRWIKNITRDDLKESASGTPAT